MNYFNGWKKNWISLPLGDGDFIWVAPWTVLSAKDWGSGSKVRYGAPGDTMEEIVELPAAKVIEAVEAARENLVAVEYLGLKPVIDPVELERQEKMAEAMGRGLAKGQKEGMDEADRESWGNSR